MVEDEEVDRQEVRRLGDRKLVGRSLEDLLKPWNRLQMRHSRLRLVVVGYHRCSVECPISSTSVEHMIRENYSIRWVSCK